MKEFNLEKALAGDPICMRDGQRVTDFHYFKDAKSINRKFVYSDNKGNLRGVDDFGRYLSSPEESELDLFMDIKKMKVYIAVNKKPENLSEMFFYTSRAYLSKESFKISYDTVQIVEVEIEVED